MFAWPELDLSEECKSFVDALLQLDPKQRLGSNGVNEIKVISNQSVAHFLGTSFF